MTSLQVDTGDKCKHDHRQPWQIRVRTLVNVDEKCLKKVAQISCFHTTGGIGVCSFVAISLGIDKYKTVERLASWCLSVGYMNIEG